MEYFLQKNIFNDLIYDYSKIKIERFKYGFIPKLDITDNFRMRLDYVVSDYENIRRKSDFIENLFEDYEVKVTLNFKNENCIVKFFNEDEMKYKIQFKIENLIVKYNNSKCYGTVDWSNCELKLLNKKLLN